MDRSTAMFRPAARLRPLSRGARPAALVLAILVVALSGCNGIMNNNPDLRWFVFSHFGAARVCPELLKTSVPIHLQERAPAVGRFFPMSCNVSLDGARRVMAVSVGGTGYGYLLPAKRIGFSMTATVEYRPDFVMAGDDLYLHAKVNRIIDGPHFQTGYIENPVMDLVGNVPPFGNMANFLGNQAVTGTLTQGFTVVHGDRGDDFSLGLIFPPQRPAHPFTVTSSQRFTFANETTDVQPAERDFLGPFEVTKNGQALFFSTTVQGPPITLVVVNKATGDAWRDMYQTGKVGPPPGPVIYSSPVQPGPVDTRRYDLTPGFYYVVVDNVVAGAGGGIFPGLLNGLNPLGLGGGGGLARVSYVAQLAN
jgi:hypothetical protein